MAEETNWLLKDLRIVRQNALNRAVELAIAGKLENIDGTKIEKELLFQIKQTADIFVHYIWFGLPNGLVTNAMTEDKLQTAQPKETFAKRLDDALSDMNPQQSIVFVKIVDEYLKVVSKVNMVKLKELIIAKFGTLPTVTGSIPKVLKEINKSEIEGK